MHGITVIFATKIVQAFYFLISKFHASDHLDSSVAVQSNLCQTRLETLMQRFLETWLKLLNTFFVDLFYIKLHIQHVQ